MASMTATNHAFVELFTIYLYGLHTDVCAFFEDFPNQKANNFDALYCTTESQFQRHHFPFCRLEFVVLQRRKAVPSVPRFSLVNRVLKQVCSPQNAKPCTPETASLACLDRCVTTPERWSNYKTETYRPGINKR